MGLGVPRWWFTAGRSRRCAWPSPSAPRRPAGMPGAGPATEPPITRRRFETSMAAVRQRDRHACSSCVFVGLMLAGVPIAVALGFGGIVAIAPPTPARRGGACRRAPEHARQHRQVPAARPADVRAGRLDLRPLGRRAPPRHLRPGLRRPRAAACCRWSRSWSRCCSAASPARARDGRRGRRRDDRGRWRGRLPGGVLGQRDRRGGGDRHPDPALDRLHRLQRQRARRLGAGAVRGRHARPACWPGWRSSCRRSRSRAATASARPGAASRGRRSGARCARPRGAWPRPC